ncbi:ArsA family ATPase [Halosimplex pelagicum]|uniref:TRC40/GET3/ArsA family transport-energizing ATPase n=1 Tax=Halosimplex pelagicum TaxID=869886 RepID=A0A7D5PAA8_9EURY|nr:TRC40/GET3/ArsA family transport-energizing ATPase [Halosimplex pelagicum]QLH84637.1 TRC40/GET3/ArsA family transport-energizing ATPase [Halosimplex pelagicum]
MSEIDVEAVDDIDDDAVPSGVDAPDYVLYGGKGGVGKTTMAAATALASARDGTATLVVSTDPAHSLSDTLETDIPAEPARIREDVPLYAAEIDPEAALEDGPFAEGGGGLGGAGGAMGGLGEMLGGAGEEMVDPLGGSMPGADEAAAIRLLIRYMDDPRFDRVVVDTAPTGHTLRLLELPDVMDSMLGKVLAMRERMGGMMENLGGMFGGDDEDVDPEEGLDDLRVLSDRIEQLRDVLQDPEQTDFRVVMVPEELSVLESERLLGRLDEFDVPVGTVVVNRVMQDLADVTDADADWFVSPDLDDCEFCQRRWDVQRDALSRSQEVFRGHDVRRVPLFAEEVQGERTLRIVAACLEE